MSNDIEVQQLIDVGTGKIAHIYAGTCPDELGGRDTRDPECPACQVLALAALAAPQQELALPFRERFKEAYDSLCVAVFDSPYWNQNMEELLTSIDAEINRRIRPMQLPAASALSDEEMRKMLDRIYSATRLRNVKSLVIEAIALLAKAKA